MGHIGACCLSRTVHNDLLTLKPSRRYNKIPIFSDYHIHKIVQIYLKCTNGSVGAQWKAAREGNQRVYMANMRHVHAVSWAKVIGEAYGMLV